jgi:excisionase family DNA binding protein
VSVTCEKETLLTTSAAAKVLYLSVDMTRRLARCGKLPTYYTTTSGHRLFRLSDVQKLARARGVRGELEPPDAAYY